MRDADNKPPSSRVGEDGGNEMKRVKQSFRLSEKETGLCLLRVSQSQRSEDSAEGTEDSAYLKSGRPGWPKPGQGTLTSG